MKLCWLQIGGVWITLLTVGFCGLVLGYLKSKKVKIHGYNYIYISYILLLGLSFSLFENQLLMGMNLVALVLSGMYWILALVGARRNQQLDGNIFLDLFEGLLVRPIKNLSETLDMYKRLTTDHKNFKYMLIGIFVSLPLVAVVISLLSTVDDLFKRFFYQLTTNFSANVGLDLLLFLLAIPLGVYFFLYVYKNMDSEFNVAYSFPTINLPSVIFMTILVIFISIYCLFFVTTSIGYLEFQKESYSSYAVSTYAREGFFQLLVVSLINLSIFAVIKRLSTNSKAITIGLTAIGIETLGLIVVALGKMGLYISSFGLTVLRFNTSIFMMILFACVSVFIIALWWHFNYTKITVLFIAICVLVISFCNTGNQIMSYNYSKYQAGTIEELDVSMFYSLGVEAIPTGVKVYNETDDENLKAEIGLYLREMASKISEMPDQITLERTQGKKLIEKMIE